MARIKQHIPSAARDGFPEELDEQEFNSLEELMAIPWVKHKKEGVLASTFHRFSLAPDPSYYATKGYTLMAEYNGGYNWWVVGFIYEKLPWLEEAFSPEWEAKRKPE